MSVKNTKCKKKKTTHTHLVLRSLFVSKFKVMPYYESLEHVMAEIMARWMIIDSAMSEHT